MSARVYRFRRPPHWRDRRYLRLTLLSLADQYAGLLLDAFILENLAVFGWRPLEVRHEVHDLIHRGLLRPNGDEFHRTRSKERVL